MLTNTDLQDRLDVLVGKHGLVGASLAVRRGQETAEAATGVLNLRTQQPATPDSLFQIGSITKVWTATLVLQLVDEGLLDLDEPVARHLPGFRVADEEATRTVTARQLLAHTSGIDGDWFTDTGRGDDAVERYVATMDRLTQVARPGATFSYGNSGFVLLGRLVEVLRGQTWDRVLRERLLDPLGLASAGTLPEEALLWGAATGHLGGPGDEPTVAPAWGIYRSTGPAGLLHSTARDQLAFAQLHLRDGLAPDGTRLLSEASARAMRTPQVHLPDPYAIGPAWGLGWVLLAWGGRQVLGHDGGTLGQAASLRVLPDDDLSVCVLTNGGGDILGLLDDLHGELFAELAGVRPGPRPAPTGREERLDPQRFVGRYVREGMLVEVTEEDGGLRLRTQDTSAYADEVQRTPPLRLLPFDGDVLLAEAPAGSGQHRTVAFYDLDGARYAHVAGRAARRSADG